MLSDVRETFWNAITVYPWVSSLANILPLSALIDFLDIPHTLHAFELNGATPLWCWPITPAGSRLILSKRTAEDACCLDQFGNSPRLICLDGRWGDVYDAASPETLRLILTTAPIINIANDNPNIAKGNARLQKLTVVRVSRLPWNLKMKRWQQSLSFMSASVLGWVVLIGLLVFSGFMHCWLSLAFLIVVPTTGVLVSLTCGGKPRELRPDPSGQYNRVVVATLHMNETEWLVFYGESVLVNSLLNHTLRSRRFLKTHNSLYGVVLRVLILGQWALVIGSAALQGWDAYLITFWVLVCILSNSFVFSPRRCAEDWAKRVARLQVERFETLLSGRRALLNTIVALNPDTFALDPDTKQEDHGNLYEGGLLWIDPILKRGANRTTWEEATRRAMVEVKNKSLSNRGKNIAIGELEDGSWAKEYNGNYWSSSILEGIAVAGKITEKAGLTGRFVANNVAS